MTSGIQQARCAEATRASTEPLAGTAPWSPSWVCLEHRGPWPQDITRHPEPAVARFARRATAAGLRPLLIRRYGRQPDRAQPDAPIRLFLADTMPSGCRITTLTVAGPEQLTDVPIPGPGEPLPGVVHPDPLLLVCTHGRRDRCCAIDGRALVTRLAAADEPGVWECSHLGGHRFAPTALVLPTGYLYGHLDVPAAVAARKAAGAGEVEPSRCRGRTTWSPAGQVAELAVRAATGLRDATALQVQPDEADQVTVIGPDGARWLVEVERAAIDSLRPTSCGAGPCPIVPVQATQVIRLS